jgi:phosphoglycolate phosphatase
MAIKLIVFDLDGTLVDSSADIANALNAASKPFGMEPVSVKEAEGLIGGGLTKLIERLLARKQVDVDKTSLLRHFLDEYTTRLTDYTRPYPQVPETLAALNGVVKSILSNKITSFTVEIAKRFGWTDFFQSIQGGDAVAEKKPSPASIFSLLDRFVVEKHEAVIVGDSAYDLEAGQRAGIHTVAALYGYGMPGFDAGAEFRMHSFSELPLIVQRLNKVIQGGEG